MVVLSDLLPLVREKCNGVIDQIALDRLKKSYRQFCIDSCYLQRSETLTVLTGQPLTLTAEDNHYVHSILSVDDDKDVELKAGYDYLATSNGELTVNSRIATVVVTYCIAPLVTMSNNAPIDGEIFKRWPDEIASGAAYLLLMMPSKEWTNYELSDFYKREYVTGYREAYRAGVIALDDRKFKEKSNRVFY